MVEPVETEPAGDPLGDADVPGWIAAHDLPGLFDVHVHFMPPPIMAAVRRHFDEAGPLLGRAWPIRYRGDDDRLVARLGAIGVRRFSALPYAHKPGVAGFLNDWAGAFAAANPGCLRSATFYPEESAAAYVEQLVADGVQIFKVHVQVGDFDLRDPLLDDVWGVLEDAGTPVVIHAGSGPVPNSHTGPKPLADVLGRHPGLTAVVAHLGAPEYPEFLELAETFEEVRLDTTMVFTDFFEELAPYPADLLPRLADLGDRVLLGSDFPNIPHPYASQLAALERLGMGEEWLRRVCWDNAAALFGS